MSLKSLLTGTAFLLGTLGHAQDWQPQVKDSIPKNPTLGFVSVEGTTSQNKDFLIPHLNIEAWIAQPVFKNFSVYAEQDVEAAYQQLGSFYNSQTDLGLGFSSKEDSLFVTYFLGVGFNSTNVEDKSTASFGIRIHQMLDNWSWYVNVSGRGSKMKASERWANTEAHTEQEVMLNYKKWYVRAQYSQLSLGPLRYDQIMRTARYSLARDISWDDDQHILFTLTTEFNQRVGREQEVVGNRRKFDLRIGLMYTLGDYPRSYQK